MKRWLIAALLLLALPLVVSAQEVTEEPLVTQAEVVLEQLINGDYAGVHAQFTAQIQAMLTVEQLQEAWETLNQQAGALQAVIGSEVDAASNAVTLHLQFANVTLALNLAFNADGQITALNFTQSRYQPTPEVVFTAPPYADESAFTETEVTINPAGDFPLSGTLTLPNGAGPFPVVVMLSGSGPNDRDETVYSNKPFRDLAWGLATQGIAVLRFDKRTLTYAQELDVATFTINDEYVTDALAALDLVRATEGIDPERIFLLGHSLGGYILPRIAAQAPDLAGLIFVAALARPLQETIVAQTHYLAELDGTVTTAEQQALDATETVRDQINALTEEDADDDTMLINAPVSYWLDLADYDPVAVAGELGNVPMLFIQGERDYQVTVADDLALWQQGLSARRGVEFVTFSSLNHLLLPGTGAPTPEEYQIPGHVDGGVITTLVEWIEAD